MRAAAFLLWALIAIALVWPFLRARRLPATKREPTPLDELVKDPVCQTYVVRSRAVRRATGGALHYFCSEDCARRYLSS